MKKDSSAGEFPNQMPPDSTKKWHADCFRREDSNMDRLREKNKAKIQAAIEARKREDKSVNDENA